MNSRTKVIYIDGIVGAIEMSIDIPDELKNQLRELGYTIEDLEQKLDS
jgi:hypothetical protein